MHTTNPAAGRVRAATRSFSTLLAVALIAALLVHVANQSTAEKRATHTESAETDYVLASQSVQEGAVVAAVKAGKLTKKKAKAKKRKKTPAANRALGKKLMLKAGWSERQWPALRKLWSRESGWNHRADNPYSSAYGIPQAMPGSKMRSAGKNWATEPKTQIRWGLRYIRDRYGSPSKALAHSNRRGWY